MIRDATFPSKLKYTVEIPVFKKKDWNNVENYRPAEILRILLKSYERGFLIKCMNNSITYSKNGNGVFLNTLWHSNTTFFFDRQQKAKINNLLVPPLKQYMSVNKGWFWIRYFLTSTSATFFYVIECDTASYANDNTLWNSDFRLDLQKTT